MDNKLLLDWARVVWENYSGDLEYRIKLAQVIATCLHTQTVEVEAEKLRGLCDLMLHRDAEYLHALGDK